MPSSEWTWPVSLYRRGRKSRTQYYHCHPQAKTTAWIQYLTITLVVAAAPPAVKPAMGHVERWGDDPRILFRICNVTTVADLPLIWDNVAHISNNRSQAAMGEACWCAVERLCSRSPLTSHTIVVMVLDLKFYLEEPDVMGDARNIFLLPTPHA